MGVWGGGVVGAVVGDDLPGRGVRVTGREPHPTSACQLPHCDNLCHPATQAARR